MGGMKSTWWGIASVVVGFGIALPSGLAAVMQFGDRDLCNTGTYSTDPTAGVALEGLLPGAVSVAGSSFPHDYPFSPTSEDFAGTDQIYVGTVQTANHDGYSNAGSRINGPQTLAMNFTPLVPAGERVVTATLGVMADDFQRPTFGQVYSVTVNGVEVPALTTALNGLDQTGPYAQFVAVGIDPAIIGAGNTLTVVINEGGDGGDGWAVDFLTVGITTAPVPEPGVVGVVASAGLLASCRRRR